MRVETDQDLDIMRTKVKSWMDATDPNKNFVWQPDGAPRHTSKMAQKERGDLKKSIT